MLILMKTEEGIGCGQNKSGPVSVAELYFVGLHFCRAVISHSWHLYSGNGTLKKVIIFGPSNQHSTLCFVNLTHWIMCCEFPHWIYKCTFNMPPLRCLRFV